MLQRSHRNAREGLAAVELSILLPFLAFLFVIAVDWSRVFYYSITVDNCARNGAVYASDPYSGVQSPYSSLSEAALADAGNLNPKPAVSSQSGSENGYDYVDCTVTYSFQTLTKLPGVPNKTSITRTVRIYKAPQFPN